MTGSGGSSANEMETGVLTQPCSSVAMTIFRGSSVPAVWSGKRETVRVGCAMWPTSWRAGYNYDDNDARTVSLAMCRSPDVVASW